MTIPEAKQKLVNWCNSQVGYHESWDGSNKYGADTDWDEQLYGWDASKVPWCDWFCHYAYIYNFGFKRAVAMTFQTNGGTALCRASADLYKQHGHWFDRLHPELCDQIFFYDGAGEINHTGIVVGVNGDQITCVEGNFGDAVGRTYYNYKISNQIAGYGRPDWSLVEQMSDSDYPENIPTVEESEPTAEPTLALPEDRHYIHLQNGDGINHPIPEVKAWQNLLLAWGYNLGIAGADGEFGSMTTNATIQFQQRVGLTPDGVVDQEEWEQAIYVG